MFITDYGKDTLGKIEYYSIRITLIILLLITLCKILLHEISTLLH